MPDNKVNLPKTNFPMRGNLPQREPELINFWSNINLYDQIRAKRKGREKFILHDGPPYANGNIHLGHLLNKVLKDFVVRSQPLLGKQCDFIPGWDCHGLPIEHKVMQELSKSKELDAIK